MVTPNNYGLCYRDDLMVDIKEDDFSKMASSPTMQLYPNPASEILNLKIDDGQGMSLKGQLKIAPDEVLGYFQISLREEVESLKQFLNL